MRKKLRTMALGLALALGLSACSGSGEPVPVERVDTLASIAAVTDQFAGVVVSDNSVTVAKEADKAVKELLVKEGQRVSEGQELFCYDSDQLQLTLDKQELEMDRLEAKIDDLKDQIKAVEKEIKKTKDSNTKTQLNIQLRQLEMELTTSSYEEEDLKTDIEYTKKMLKNVHIYSSITGTVRKIDESNPEQYITIQQSGAYRVKGRLNEMSMGMGVMEGAAVQIISRLDPSRSWTGTVELVDYENAQQNSYDTMNYGVAGDGTNTTSSYPFYVALDSTDGLLLGQHVYIQLKSDTVDPDMVYIPGNYLMDLKYSDETGATTAAAWAVGEDGRLEKRAVTLGEYDIDTGCYQVLEGLEFTDYVADPANPNCREGAEISIDGKTGYIDDSGLTPEEQAAIAASIAHDIENAEE